jgi:hypothetical protein
MSFSTKKQLKVNKRKENTMGCDIHMNYEMKSDESWKFLDYTSEFIQGTYDDGSPKYNYDLMFDSPLHVNRNYDLFAILANVRNGYGFGGVPTSNGFEVISLPRGLPVDATDEVRAISDEWGDDGHSHSWFLLNEVIDYDYSKTIIKTGIVSVEEYKSYLANGKPDGWCGGVAGKMVQHVTVKDMEKIVKGDFDIKEGINYFTSVAWEETYRSAIGDGWFKTMEYLNDNYGADNIRLVFWFDN